MTPSEFLTSLAECFEHPTENHSPVGMMTRQELAHACRNQAFVALNQEDERLRLLREAALARFAEASSLGRQQESGASPTVDQPAKRSRARGKRVTE
jgi:hypothetical protein